MSPKTPTKEGCFLKKCQAKTCRRKTSVWLPSRFSLLGSALDDTLRKWLLLGHNGRLETDPNRHHPQLAGFWRFPYPNSRFTLSYPCISVLLFLKMTGLHVLLHIPIFLEATPAAPVQQRWFFHGHGPWFWRIVDPNQRWHPKGNDAPSIRKLRWNFLDLQFLGRHVNFANS